MPKLLAFIVFWFIAPLSAFIMDLLTPKTIAFAVICFLSGRAFANLAEWLTDKAKQQNFGSENGRRVAWILAILSGSAIALSVVTELAAQANYFFHWVA